MTDFDGPGLSQVFEQPVIFLPSCGSTNAEAMAAAARGALDGTLVVADAQTGGKGRLGRTWVSPQGVNLYFSLVLRPALDPPQVPLLSLAAAVAVAETLDLCIKWPNDVLDPDRKKIAGILAEMEVQAGVVEHVVLGAGINVNQVEFGPDLPHAGSLALLRGTRDRVRCLVDCVAAIERRCGQVGTADEAGLLDAWRARWMDRDRQVRAEGLEGVARDVAADGALVVETAKGVERVVAGDVVPAR